MTMNSTKDVKMVGQFFCKMIEANPANVPSNWVDHAEKLLNVSGFSPQEAANFIRWAVTENISDKPQFNSVAYISKSKDKFATLMKHLDNLLAVYNRNKTAINKVAEAEARLAEPVRPLPRDIAKWLMTGPGVNQPLDGWTSARQKMDSVKRGWYGKGGEQQADPDGLDIEALFAEHIRQHRKKEGIRKENHA
jgi:hypothetical protein